MSRRAVRSGIGGTAVALRLLAGIALILANGFLIAIEFALTRVRQYPASAFDRGDVPGERRQAVLDALAIGDRPIREVTTPVEAAVFVSTEAPIEENLARIGANPHTRLPLIGSEPSDFRGIVYVPSVIDRIDDLRDRTAVLKGVAAPPVTLPGATPISDAVDGLQVER